MTVAEIPGLATLKTGNLFLVAAAVLIIIIHNGAPAPVSRQIRENEEKKSWSVSQGTTQGNIIHSNGPPRCGTPDLRYELYGSWIYNNLTYNIDSYPSSTNLNDSIVDVLIARAFQIWAEHSSLIFTRKRTVDADIKLKFVKRRHGDPYTFDGPQGILAHAFYPIHGFYLAGEAHFDDDEFWTHNTRYGINLLYVAVHELGHSLGLRHSRNRNAIMYPYYCHSEVVLSEDDINGIQNLYGPPRTKKPTTSAPTTIFTTDETTATSESVTSEEMTTEAFVTNETSVTTETFTTAEIFTTMETVTTEGPTGPRCVDVFTQYTNTLRSSRVRLSGIYILDDCEHFCRLSTYCWGYSIIRNRCYVHPLNLRQFEASDFYYKRVIADRNEITYIRMANKRHSNGYTISRTITKRGCEDFCSNTRWCVGYTYRREDFAYIWWSCIIHVVTERPASPIFNHYIKDIICS